MMNLIQLSQAIHNANLWHQLKQFQNAHEIQMIPFKMKL